MNLSYDMEPEILKENDFCPYATITQYTSIYKYIQMAEYSDWNVIIDTTYDMIIIRPIC